MSKPTPEQLQAWTEETHQLMEQAGVTKTPRAQVRVLRERGAKHCPGCETVKPLDEFAAKKSNSDGLQPRCRSCSSANYREYYSRDPRGQVQRVAEYRSRNPLGVRITNGRIRAEKFGAYWEEFDHRELLDHWSSIGLDKDRSAFSGVLLTPENYGLDHLYPLSDPDGPGHRKEMLVPCTQEENRRKGTGHWIRMLNNEPDPDAPELVKKALEPGAPSRSRRTLMLQL